MTRLLTVGRALALVLAAVFAAAERPNVLLAIADDWSYGHAGVYGCDWVATPAFDRVAREGMLFHHAYTPNAKCAPSRAILLTGRNSWQLEEAANHVPNFPVKFKTYVEALGDAGYHVGYTGKGWSPGKAAHADGSPRRLAGPHYGRRKLDPPAEHISDNDYAANFKDFLDEAADAPWCFWYGALEPHRAYEQGSGERQGGKSLDQVDRVPAYWPDNATVRGDMLDYAFEVEHFDRHLGKILAELEERGEIDNTLVIVTSDHGMPFPRCKGQAYEHSNHIPLAIRWPGGVGRQKTRGFVSLTDLAPTILDLAGVVPTKSGMAPMEGRSLAPQLLLKSLLVNTSRSHLLIGKERHDIGRPNDAGYPIRGLVNERYLYLRNDENDRWPIGNPETGYPNCDGSPTKTAVLDAFGQGDADRYWRLNFGKRPDDELYDLQKDADCVNNLADDPDYAEKLAAMRRQMEAELLAQGDPRQRGEGAVFDAYPYAEPSRRGFYEKAMAGRMPPAGWINVSDFRPEQNEAFTAPESYTKP
ncbi:Arylsulfatase [Planctomycetes bacterium MalM25]|nr:Arylsulfatase [Planctomycetes bacterium MalM25]